MEDNLSAVGVNSSISVFQTEGVGAEPTRRSVAVAEKLCACLWNRIKREHYPPATR